MKFLLSAMTVLCCIVEIGFATPLTVFVTPPDDTAVDAKLYIAGNFQNWQPGQDAWRLHPLADGRYTITADFEVGQGLQFKFTKGDWLTVEKGVGGEEIANRTHRVSSADTLHLQVVQWASGQATPRKDTMVGQVELVSWPEFLDDRQVWIYLPPGYEAEADRHYPVLYMFDGQNVFNDATSFVGEWKVDESLERLIVEQHVSPLIVVAVANLGSKRIHEYTPWSVSGHGLSGGGQDHLQHWIDELLPRVNAEYRTQTSPDNTGLAGSSLGGLMSLYGGFAHPDVFGKIGAFSPSLRWAASDVFDFCRTQSPPPSAVYADMGTREEGNIIDDNNDGTDDYIEAIRSLRQLLIGRGYEEGRDLLVVEDVGARHNEIAWSRRFPSAVEFLFPNR